MAARTRSAGLSARRDMAGRRDLARSPGCPDATRSAGALAGWSGLAGRRDMAGRRYMAARTRSAGLSARRDMAGRRDLARSPGCPDATRSAGALAGWSGLAGRRDMAGRRYMAARTRSAGLSARRDMAGLRDLARSPGWPTRLGPESPGPAVRRAGARIRTNRGRPPRRELPDDSLVSRRAPVAVERLVAIHRCLPSGLPGREQGRPESKRPGRTRAASSLFTHAASSGRARLTGRGRAGRSRRRRASRRRGMPPCAYRRP